MPCHRSQEMRGNGWCKGHGARSSLLTLQSSVLSTASSILHRRLLRLRRPSCSVRKILFFLFSSLLSHFFSLARLSIELAACFIPARAIDYLNESLASLERGREVLTYCILSTTASTGPLFIQLFFCTFCSFTHAPWRMRVKSSRSWLTCSWPSFRLYQLLHLSIKGIIVWGKGKELHNSADNVAQLHNCRLLKRQNCQIFIRVVPQGQSEIGCLLVHSQL